MPFVGPYAELLDTTDAAERRDLQYLWSSSESIEFSKKVAKDRERWQKGQASWKDKCGNLRKAEVRVLVVIE